MPRKIERRHKPYDVRYVASYTQLTAGHLVGTNDSEQPDRDEKRRDLVGGEFVAVANFGSRIQESIRGHEVWPIDERLHNDEVAEHEAFIADGPLSMA